MKSLQELMNLKGRGALITGGAGHIGSVLAETLAELGANVVLLDLDKENCERVSKKFKINTLWKLWRCLLIYLMKIKFLLSQK